MVVQLRRQCRKFVIIYNHREALCAVLPDERFDKRKCFTATRRSNHPCASETVCYIHKSFSEFSIVIVSHRDIHAVPVLYQLLALFKTFIFQIEAVFHQTLLEELRYVVQRDMHENDTREGGDHVEDDVQRQRVQPHSHRMAEQPYRQHQQRKAAHERIQHLPPGIELQMLLGSGADTGDADEQHRGDFAVHQVAVVVNHPPLDAPVNVNQYATPMVEYRRVDGILEKFHQHGDVNDRTEYLVEPL